MLKKNLFLWSALFAFTTTLCGQTLGTVRNNTNAALPSSYNFREYVFPEPNDQGTCPGRSNTTAALKEVFMAQTHRHTLDHPFFFTIGHRPALLQLAVTGTGPAPDVKVEGTLNGRSLGVLCMAGPATLKDNIDLSIANFEDYFSVTLPKSWIQNGLSLTLTVGSQSKTISAAELKIGPYTELNLVMFNMDVLDYNTAPPIRPIFNTFLQEMASSIPASVVRFGTFPGTLEYPEFTGSNNTEQLVRLKSRGGMAPNGILSDGSINSTALLSLANLHKSTGDYLSTVYFGNTLNLAPGGWGGGKSFVGPDFTDIFIHELGHALSLPHWGEGSYKRVNPGPGDFLYPYGGAGDNGGGRGQTWNFVQHGYKFEDYTCRVQTNNHFGKERSDCMQRTNPCLGSRGGVNGPWDGFGDFSALAIHRYLSGGSVRTGKVLDGPTLKDFQFSTQQGFPVVSLRNGSRVYTRDALQPQATTFEERFDLPGDEKLEQNVYLVYGSAHESQTQANIVYKPIAFKGTLPPVIDPTNPATFAQLKGTTYIPQLFATRDITLKLIYEDGSVLHALNPFHSYDRAPYSGGFGIWRRDICNFSLVVPGDKILKKVELYKRPFCVRNSNDNTKGNINFAANNITAENFMAEAVFQAQYEFGGPQVLGSNTIGNRVWHDLNQNGLDDAGEKGIPGVSLVLWRDSNGDGRPDAFSGVVKTDAEGYYSFTGLTPGNYLVFVWSVDNWQAGQPLFNMVPTPKFVNDPNTDINLDNNGRPGNLAWGLSPNDIVSGMITLTADGEPLGDGDRQHSWFNYDPSGNMTVDFGFHVRGAVVVSVNELAAQGVKMYPNPFSNQLVVETTDANEHSISIIDLYGRLVFESGPFVSKNTISTANLPAGVYSVALRNKYKAIEKTINMVKVE